MAGVRALPPAAAGGDDPCMARSRSRSCSAAVLVAALATALAGQKEAKEPSSYDTALARYHECMKRKALTHQTEGRKVLATTRRPEALKILIADYAEAKAYPEYSRYTLATLFGRNFDGAPCAVPLAALRQACSKPVDTWLWVNSLGSQIRADSGEQALAIVHDDKNLLHKAAAIVALGQTRSAALSPAIVTVCAGFPAREADRNLLLGAMSGAILENKSKANDEQFRKGLVAYIGLLAPAVKLTAPAKLQIARHLQWTLGGPAQFEFRIEAFNLLNRTNFRAPNGNRSAAGFGTIIATNDPRQLQLGFKLLW